MPTSPSRVERRVGLLAHASSRGGPARAIEAVVRRSAPALLNVVFELTGDVSRIRIPDAGPTRIGKDLWRHTCFEVFVAAEGRPSYRELNFAPSGEWALHAFLDYRDGGPIVNEALQPRIARRAAAHRFELEASVPLDRLSPELGGASLLLGLSAVIEASDGMLSYWALRHPASRPDFHHRDGFSFRLEKC